MKHLILIFIFSVQQLGWLKNAEALPIVDKGVFVITGVKTCQNGLGYCILGNDCTVDKEFVLDTLGGHCDGLRKAFTPRTFFTCCAYNDLNATTAASTIKPIVVSSPSTTAATTTTTTAADVSLESNETSSSVESAESPEVSDQEKNSTVVTVLKPTVITLDELLQNGTFVQLDAFPTERPDSTSTTTTEAATTNPVTVIPGQNSEVEQEVTTTTAVTQTSSPELLQVDTSTANNKQAVVSPAEEEHVTLKIKTENELVGASAGVFPAESKPELEYVSHVDGDTNIIELKSSTTPEPEIYIGEPVHIVNDDELELDGGSQEIYLKEEVQPAGNSNEIPADAEPFPDLDPYSHCGIPQMKQKEIRVATADSMEMNEQVGGDIGSCWLGGLVRSPTSLFSINDPGSYICSGALIGENAFLTSATCISRLIGNDLKLFRIILGTKHIIHPSNGVTYNGIYREIVDYKVHANYSVVGQLRFHDIGIVHLKARTLLEAFRQDEMQYCTLCLPRPHTNYDKCIVSGYSHPSPSNGQDSDGIVHEAEQYIESQKYCEGIINTQKVNLNYDGFTCASGVPNGEACFSPRDAGSPLACNMKNTSKYFLAGLFSSGFHCGTHDAPIIYTNIKQYLNWIYQILYAHQQRE